MGTAMHNCSTASAPCLCTGEEAVRIFPLSHFCHWNPLGGRACWGSRISGVTIKQVHLSSPAQWWGEANFWPLPEDFTRKGDSSILCCCNEDQEAPSQESSHLPPMEESCCPSSRLLLSVLGTEEKHFAYPDPLFFHQQNETSNLGKKNLNSL